MHGEDAAWAEEAFQQLSGGPPATNYLFRMHSETSCGWLAALGRTWPVVSSQISEPRHVQTVADKLLPHIWANEDQKGRFYRASPRGQGNKGLPWRESVYPGVS